MRSRWHLLELFPLPCLAFLLMVALVAIPAAAQGKAGKEPAPKPPLSTTEEVLAMWNEAGRKIVAMAEDFPEAKYDFEPNPEVRSFAEQILHVAGGHYLFLKAAKGEKWSEADGNPPRKNYPNKAAIVAFLKKSYADVNAYLKGQGDAGLAKAVKYPFGNRMVLQSFLWMDFVNHDSEHYGQLVVYYRVNNLVPPESRPRR